MINIAALYHIGRKFTSLKNTTNASTEYVCIGYGQNPNDGSNYLIAETFDKDVDGIVMSTHLIKDVVFHSPAQTIQPPRVVCG